MKQEKKIYFPLFASESLNGGIQSAEESRRVWKQIMNLPDGRRNVILSTNMAEAIAELNERFGFSDHQTEALAVLVRQFFCREIANSTFWDQVNALLRSGAPLAVSGKSLQQFIQTAILDCAPDVEISEETKEEVKAIPRVPLERTVLLKAFAKYPRLGSQMITSNKLKLKSQAEPVRPSLANWMKVYRDELGIGHHESVQRADFLYRTQNTRGLSAQERARIELIVRALEDEEPVSINPDTQEIIFAISRQSQPVTSVSVPKPQPTKPQPTQTPMNTEVPYIFEKFQEAPPRQAAHNFPSSLSHVGTKTFEPQAAPLEHTREEILERLKNIPQTLPKPEELAQSTQACPSAQVPLGKIQFSSKQVFPGERIPEKPATPQPRVSMPQPASLAPRPQSKPDTEEKEPPSDDMPSGQSMFHIKPS